MKKSPTVLSFDIGRKAGWAFKDSVAIDSGHFATSTYTEWKTEISKLIDSYSPVAIVIGKPNLFGLRTSYNTLEVHFGYIGILALKCEEKGIYLFPMGDTTARKIVFGSGKIKKEEVAQKLGVTSLDEADAITLAEAQYQLLQEANAPDAEETASGITSLE